MGFPLHKPYIGEYLHFRYLKCLVITWKVMLAQDAIVGSNVILVVNSQHPDRGDDRLPRYNVFIYR